MLVEVLATKNNIFGYRKNKRFYWVKDEIKYPQAWLFKNAVQFGDSDFGRIMDSYRELTMFKNRYSSSCRESLLSHASTQLSHYEAFHYWFPYNWIRLTTYKSLSKFKIRFFNYMFYKLSRQIPFKYHLTEDGSTILFNKRDFSVPFASFLLYFVRYSNEITGLPNNKRMKLEYLNNLVDILVSKGNTSSNIAFALWHFLNKNNPGIFKSHDGKYGSITTSGISTHINYVLSRGNYISDYREFAKIYGINVLTHFGDKIAYQFYIDERLPYSEFRSNRYYNRSY